MSLKTADLVYETTTSTGAGPFALAGAVRGNRRFSGVPEWNVGDSEIGFIIRDPVDPTTGIRGPNWMSCSGTLTDATHLDVDEVFASSNNGSPVSFGLGPKDIYSAITSSVLNTLIANGGTDVTDPTLTSATVANGTPSVINLAFPEPMDVTGVPPNSAFAVSAGHTISSMAWADSTHLNITVASAFTNGESARTLAYTVQGTNPLMDTSGNQLQAIAAQAIVNNVGATDTTPPTITSRTVANSTPTHIDLVFSEAMDMSSGSTPAASDFAVGGGSHTPSAFAFVDATHATLTVPTVTAGETLTLSYTQGTNKLKDAALNLLANVTTAAITNNVAGGTVPRFTSISTHFVESGSSPNWVYTDSVDTFGTPPGNAVGGVLNLQFQNATAGSFKLKINGFLAGTPGVSPQIGLGIASAGSPAGYATLPIFLYTGDGTYTVLLLGTAQTPLATVAIADGDWLHVHRAGTTGSLTFVGTSPDGVTITDIFGTDLGTGALGIQCIIDTTDDPGVGAHVNNLTATGLA